MKDLYKDITKDIGESEIIQGKIIKIDYTREPSSRPPLSSERSIYYKSTSIITVEYTVSGNNFTIVHKNIHSWEKDKSYKIGDKKEVIYNIYHPAKAYLKLSVGYYVSFVFWVSAGILIIIAYIAYLVFFIKIVRLK